MTREIISHDVETAVARIKFEHNGVVHEAEYQLDYVIPGTKQVFEQLGIPFGKVSQMKAIDALERVIEAQIESGMIVNMPEVAPINAEGPEVPEAQEQEDPVPPSLAEYPVELPPEPEAEPVEEPAK